MMSHIERAYTGPIEGYDPERERQLEIELRLDELHRQRNVELAKNSAERQEIWDRFTAAEAALSVNRTEVGA
jgi:hypothetical protein